GAGGSAARGRAAQRATVGVLPPARRPTRGARACRRAAWEGGGHPPALGAARHRTRALCAAAVAARWAELARRPRRSTGRARHLADAPRPGPTLEAERA